VPDRPGVAARVFTALADAHIQVDMIVQNVSAAGSTDISFTLHQEDVAKAEKALGPVARDIGAGGVTARGGIAKLSVVGIGMRSHSGVAARLFEALSAAGVNIQMISTSEIKIAVILDEASIAEAAQVAHAAFGLDGGSPAATVGGR